MKKIKILSILLMLLLLVSCKDNEEELNVEEKIKDLKTINLNAQITQNEKTPFSINYLTETIVPAITYEKEKEDKKEQASNEETQNENTIIITPSTNTGETMEKTDTANINLSREIELFLEYDQSEEAPEKIYVDNFKISSEPNVGTPKAYAINEGDYYSYISLMRDNELDEKQEYTKDLEGKELKDGKFQLRLSVTIDEIVKTKIENLIKNDYKTILKNSNISKDDLTYKISFTVIISTKSNTYALNLAYSSLDIDLYTENNKVISFENPIYFIKL